MTDLTREHLFEEVLPIVHQETWDDIAIYVVSMPRVPLWASFKRTASFYRDTALITLYHDITGKGHQKIHEKVKSWYKVSHNSLQHNISRMRKELASWGKSKIERGTLEDWNQRARLIKYNNEDVRIHLKWDSTDFPLESSNRASSLYFVNHLLTLRPPSKTPPCRLPGIPSCIFLFSIIFQLSP